MTFMNRAQRRKAGNRKPININKAQLQRAKEEATQKAVDTLLIEIMCISIWALHNRFKWGSVRLQRFLDEFFEAEKDLEDGRISFEDIKKTVEEETGLSVE